MRHPDGGKAPGSYPTSWVSGQLLLGDFRVERKLGEGGMGAVYLVQSRSTCERFAVKKTHLRDPGSEAAFLAELQTWIDLPPHPHLAACRFFRTIGDEVTVFAELVEGGSLAEWIGEGRLTRPEQILDVAVQAAWGLHAAHEHGLVHQDVKPGNVLVTADGVAKVSDFGLARARAAAGEVPASAARSAMLRSLSQLARGVTGRTAPSSRVSCGGMTLAYRSPEQAAGRRLNRRTDVWSWGLAVLEMFTGEVTWMDGQAAADALEDYLGSGAAVAGLPPMPAELADVLRRCFRPDPAERWPTLAEAAEAVRRVYRGLLGEDHLRPTPGEVTRRPGAVRDDDPSRRSEPRWWLERALREQGRAPAAADALMPARVGSRRARAIADIAAMAEARRIYEELIAAGRSELVSNLAFLCHFKAQTHELTRDLPGALLLRRRVLALLEQAVNDQGREELTDALAEAHINHGYILWLQKDYRAALAAYDRALDLLGGLVEQAASEAEADRVARGLAFHLATVHLNKAAALSGLGDYRASLALNDQAKTILSHLLGQEDVKEEDRPELTDRLAGAHMGEAEDLECLGRYFHAGHAYDEAIALRERLVTEEGRGELAEGLSRAYVNKAIMLRKLHQPRQAAELYDKVIALRERLVHEQGRREMLPGLARACGYKADVLDDLEEHDAARALFDRAIALWEQLVNREGEAELARDLAMAYLSKGSFLVDVKDYAGAVVQQDRAIAILERLAVEEQRDEVAENLAGAIMNKSHTLKLLGDHAGALALFDRVIPAWQRLVEQGRRELAPELAKAYGNKARVAESAGDYKTALALHDQAVEVYERLVTREGWGELKGELAGAWVDRAAVRDKLGDRLTALAELSAAIPILKEEVARKSSPKLRKQLETAESLGTCLYWLYRLDQDDATKPGGAVEVLLSRLAQADHRPRADRAGLEVGDSSHASTDGTDNA